MAINYPATLDDATSLAAPTMVEPNPTTDATKEVSDDRVNACRDSHLALQAKVGSDASAVTGSLDYRVKGVRLLSTVADGGDACRALWSVNATSGKLLSLGDNCTSFPGTFDEKAYIDWKGKLWLSDELEIDGALNHDGTTVGFYGVAPTTRPAAITQTYATADRTLGAYTPDNESAAYTGAADGEAKLVDINALRVAYENLRAFAEDLAQLVNILVDDLRLLGLEQ